MPLPAKSPCSTVLSTKAVARVGKRRRDDCTDPSAFSRRGPATATSPLASRCSTITPAASPTSSASGFSRSRYRPPAAAMPWLLPAVNPRFSPLASRRTPGNSRTTISALPSDEALSTTSTSRARVSVGVGEAGDWPGTCRRKPGLARTDERQRRSRSRTFQETMITERSGARVEGGHDIPLAYGPGRRDGRQGRGPAVATCRISACALQHSRPGRSWCGDTGCRQREPALPWHWRQRRARCRRTARSPRSRVWRPPRPR